MSKLGGGGVEVIWTKSKRTATFFVKPSLMYYESIGDYMAGLVGTEVGDKCFTTFDLQRNIQVQRVSVLHQSRNSIPENANAPF